MRLASLAPWLDGGWIPTHLTAAWVWGAAKSPRLSLQFTVPNGVRKPNYTTPDVLVRGLSIASHELEDFGGFSVTTPLRTICDLLRVRAELKTPEQVACRLLLRLVPNGREAVAEALESRRPHRAVAQKNFRRHSQG